MNHLLATLQTLAHMWRERRAADEPELGASTIEIVFWAVGLLALAGIVYAALTTFINTKVGQIR